MTSRVLPPSAVDWTAQPGLVTQSNKDLTGGATAVLSADGTYRYQLTRRWAAGPTAVWILLNPSTADAFHTDPTLRRCLGFAAAWRCGALTLLNLFAVRATDPAAMLSHPDPVGPHNDLMLQTAITAHAGLDTVWVAGWGAHGGHRHRDQVVRGQLARAGVRLRCLGTTESGQPRHPLYLKASTPLLAMPDPGQESTPR